MTRRRLFAVMTTVITAFFLLVFHAPIVSRAGDDAPARRVQQAWENAREVGQYHFATTIEQITFPAPTLANVGRSTRTDHLFLEGDTNLPDHTLELTLWRGGGNLLNPKDGVEIRINGDRAQGRPIGGTWQDIDDFSDSFAPAGDLTAYLSGAKDIRQVDDARATAEGATHYTFSLDGPAFAEYIRRQMEDRLAAKGILPAGLSLDTADQFREATGQGEIWIDARNFPLRLSLHVEYPRQPNGERIEANIKTDFSKFADPAFARNPVVRLAGRLGLPANARDLGESAQRLAAIFGFAGLALLIVYYRRSKLVYATVAILVIISMVGTPLLHSQQVYAFYKKMDEKRAEQEQTLQNYDSARQWQTETQTSDWDPRADPLAAPPEAETLPAPSAPFDAAAALTLPAADEQDTTDTDNDGLTDAQETQIGTKSDNADSDGDGLSDGVEVLQLGTDPQAKDSDLDEIPDNLEVAGFTLPDGAAPWYDTGAERWYSDPNSADTNNDGILDGIECAPRTDTSATVDTACPDTDGDNIPDIFDDDNDGDGVKDRIDLSPFTATGTPDQPFTRENPFQLTVNHLKPQYPVFVDVQLRPKNPEHLTYALNVLDWPSDDTAGQIQRKTHNHSTFATAATDAQIAANPSLQNGDMRLIPMLEVQIPWQHAPLTKTLAATAVQLRGQDVTANHPEPTYTTWLTASVKMQQTNANTLHFQFNLNTDDVTATVYPGNCSSGPTGDAVYRFIGMSDGYTYDSSSLLSKIADGEHALVMKKNGHTAACATIPDIPDGGNHHQPRMIDPAPLRSYGISIKDSATAGNLLMYVPLNVVNDETGGANVAFSARLPYHTSAAGWGGTQQMRVVWMVQALTDYCRPMPADYPDTFRMLQEDNWCNMSVNWVTDVPQVVHTYDESWTLTGLSVREDHGLDVAIAYEDPAKEDEAARAGEGWLWLAARDLNEAFVSGRDESGGTDNNGNDIGNGIRDFGLVTQKDGKTVADKELTVSVISDTWGIPITSPLTIQNYPTYATQDDIAQIMMTETVHLLDSKFSGYRDTGANAPTLLFLREERYRNGGLDSQDTSVSGSTVTVGMASDTHPLNTLAEMNWAPYRYQNDKWQSYPLAEYWSLMGARLSDLFPPEDESSIPDISEDEREEIAQGRILLAKAYYLSLAQGQLGLVQMGEHIIYTSDTASTDAELKTKAASIVNIVGNVTKKVVGQVTEDLAEEIYNIYKTSQKDIWYPTAWSKIGKPIDMLKAFGKGLKKGKDNLSGIVKGLKGEGTYSSRANRALGGLGAAVAIISVVSITLSIINLFDLGATATFAIQTTINSLNAISAGLNAVKTFFTAVKDVQEAGKSLMTAINEGVSSASKASTVLGVIGLVITVAVTWGAFIATMAASHIKFWSVTFNSALAGTIAATITAVIMFAIMLIPVIGAIIVAIIAMIDAIVAALCGAFGWDDAKVGQYVCKGISGWVTEGIKWIIWDYDLVVDLEAADRFQLSGFNQTFVNPRTGVAVGAQVNYSAHVTNTINLSKMPTDWKPLAYPWQRSLHTLKRSTFDYQWQNSEIDIHDDLTLGAMSDKWQLTDGNRPIYISRDIATGQPMVLQTAGINRPADLYLAEGYAVPGQECWAVPVYPFTLYPLAPVCYIRADKNTLHIDMGANLVYDVFPATLDGFYELTAVSGGYAPAWGQTGDTTFLRQKDADGDGLLGKADGGSDPDDSRWDSDGDGLSDAFELQHGSNPADIDADGDGLSDMRETELGTDPNRADTDADGLPDSVEVQGWLFVYGFAADGSPLSTWVTSDPSQADTDSDGLSDLQEKVYGLNPRVLSNPHIINLTSEVSEQNAPKLLLQFSESNGAVAFADRSGAENNAQCAADCPTAGVNGVYGTAVNFGSAESLLSPGNSIDDAPAFTIAAWVKLNSTPNRLMRLVSLRNWKGLLWYDSGDLLFRLRTGGSDTDQDIRVASDMQAGKWYHLAATFDGSTMKLFRDGQQIGSQSVSGSVRHGDGVRLSYGNAAQSLDGALDEVAVFDYAMSRTQINQLRHARYNLNDLIVKPGDTLRYHATVENNLLNRYAQGLFDADFGDALSGNVPPVAFVLPPKGITETNGTLAVVPTAASSVFSLTQRAGALMTDWTAQSNNAAVWLKLDEANGSTTFMDSSGRQPPHDGACNGNHCPAAVPAVFGNGLHFDEQNDEVVAKGVDFGDWQQVTLATWVKFDSFPNHKMRLLTLGNSAAYLEYDGGQLAFYVAGGVVTAGNLQPGQFYHVAGVYDGDKIRIYINGAKKEEGNIATGGDIAAGNRLKLSRSNRPLDGVLDDVRVYRRALGGDEINTLYGAPILHMPLDELAQQFGTTYYRDDSQVGNRGFCGGSHCPDSAGGIIGNAVKMNGMDYINLADNSQLNLHDGQFSLSAWVYPDRQVEPQDPACPLRIRYYNSSGKMVAVRCETGDGWSSSGWQIDHNWGDGKPDNINVTADHFRVTWTGDYYFPAGDYSFTVDGDDTVGVEVDDSAVVTYIANVPNSSEYMDRQATKHLSAGVHTVKVEYTEDTGKAFVRVRWTPPAVQGIFGANTGKKDAYPTLETVGRKLRIGFGDGSQFVSSVTTDTVLTADEWNHVVVTYNAPNLTLYVNGQRVQGWNLDAGTLPPNADTFDLGRSSSVGSIYINKLHVVKAGDYGSYAEIFLKWKGVRLCLSGMEDSDDLAKCLWKLGDGDDRDIHTTETVSDGRNTFQALEEDKHSDGLLGTGYFSANDLGEKYLRFDWTQQSGVGNTQIQLFMGDQTHWAINNPSVPFRGRLDELTFYRRAIADTEVNELYHTRSDVLMHIPLDDPPGSSNFGNTVDLSGQNDGVCAGATCPTAGVSGRLNQSAYFDGAHNYLTIANSKGTGFGGNPFTLAAWVNPQGSGTILAKYNHHVSREYRLYVDSDHKVRFFYRGSDTLVSPNAIPFNRWTHVAVSNDGSTFRLLINGQQVASGANNSSFEPGNAPVTIGAHFNNGAPAGFFHGKIDDVQLFSSWKPNIDIDLFRYRAAPALQLHLDEQRGATTFTDAAGGASATCAGAACPTAGIDGQIGWGAKFDGVDDALTVADSDATRAQTFAVGMWVRPTAIKTRRQLLLGKMSADGGHRNYALLLMPGNIIRYSMQGADCSTFHAFDSIGSLIPNMWNHVMMVYDGSNFTLYLNGNRDSSHAVSGSACIAANPIRIGGGVTWAVPFAGDMDEVTIYNPGLLSKYDVGDIFQYQSAWVEEHVSHLLTVDADPPTSVLKSDRTILPNEFTLMHIAAHDGQSRVTLAELGVQKTGWDDTVWIPADACLDSDGSAWCPEFDPTQSGWGEGSYTLQTRATDAVGNRETPSAGMTVTVDGTPPTVTAGIADGTLVTAAPHPTRRNAWAVPLAGSVSDAASGVADVSVTLLDSHGQPVGAGTQAANVNGNGWSLNYIFDSDPHGTYTLRVTATDNALSAQTGTGNQQTLEITINVDAHAPVATLTTVLPEVVSDTLALQGNVSELPAPASGVAQTEVAWQPVYPGSPWLNRPVPAGEILHLPFEDAPDENGNLIFRDVSGSGADGVCDSAGGKCPVSGQAGRTGNALRFNGTDDRVNLGNTAINQLTDNFTLMAWVKPNQVARYRQQIIGSARRHSANGFGFGLHNAGLRFSAIGIHPYDTTAVQLKPDRWAHVAVTVGGGNITFYVNGQAAESMPVVAPIQPDTDDPLLVGTDTMTRNWNPVAPFDGLIDDVRVFNRALTAAEIGDMFRAAGPALVLPFEGAWATDGSPVADKSGWEQQVTLHTGDAFNKSVRGAAGSYGLSFDGTDDYAGVAENDGLDLSHGQFTEALWVFPDATGGNAPLISSGAYDDAPARYPFIRIKDHTRLEIGFGDGSTLHTFTTGYVLTANAWNHVVTTFDGSLYKIYVNGADVASTNQFAGMTPASTHRFDVGRGVTVDGVPACATFKLKAFTPVSWARQYRIKVDGNVLFTSDLYPKPDTHVAVNQTVDFCSSTQISMEYIQSRRDPQWQSMGNTTLTTAPAFFRHTFTTGSVGATVDEQVVYTDTDVSYFKGALDDVRLYTRALSDLEIADLYRAGWHVAALGTPGAVETTWSDTVPAGLEGAYRLDLRGADTLGHFDVLTGTRQAWRGSADTLSPRLTVNREQQGDVYHYTVTAQDFNLTADGFVSQCGIGVVTDREYYQSPWYRAMSGQKVSSNQKLFRLTAECDVAADALGTLAEVGAYDTPGLAQRVTIGGDTAYVADGARGVQIIDVSDRSDPQLSGVYDTSDPVDNIPINTRGVALHNGYLYLADYNQGLLILDISDPAAPALVGRNFADHLNGDIEFSGNMAFVASFYGLTTMNVSDPANPTWLDTWHTGSGDAGSDVALNGNHAYLAVPDASEIDVVDISLPQVMVQENAIAVPGNPQSVAVANGYLYAASGAAGLLVFDISQPVTPTLIGQWDSPGYARDVTVNGDTAYVADGRRGLQVVNISDPYHPTPTAGNDTPGGASGVAVDTGYAYVADYRYGLRVIDLTGTPRSTTVCDTAGNCTHAVETPRESTAIRATAETSGTLGITILNMPAVLENFNPVTIIGEAHATTDSLRALTVTVDSSPIYTETWTSGAVTETTWLANWSLFGFGIHRLQADLLAWDGNTATDTITVTVDAMSPAVIITPTVLTQTRYHAATRALDFSGLATDDGGITRVQLGIFGNEIDAGLNGNDWLAKWYLGAMPPPDGETYTVTARATDIAGRQTTVTESVTVDVVPPTPVTPTLTSGGTPVAPGDTLRGASPTLTLNWSAATDGSGLSGYRADWQIADSGGITHTTVTIPATAPRTVDFSPPEGTKVTAAATAADIYGQTNWQSLLPVYADTPLTPDYVPLIDPDGIYLGWMDSGCSLLGVDRRVNRSALPGASLSAEQQLFATWDATGLRLAWKGANWGSDGDLFVYLDTAAGGTNATFNPTPENTTVTLPLSADYLIWVRDADTALLLHWDGTQWNFITALIAAAGQYRFAAGHTDLYIPFDALGISDPAAAPLSLVAFAAAEDSLQLWATLPNANPIGSGDILLTNDYHWDTVGDGVCPNGSDGSSAAYLDTDLVFGFGAEPADSTVMGDGQTIQYTIGYENYGTVTATNVSAEITTADALRLSSGATHQTLALGDVAPGAHSSITVTGTIDLTAARSAYAACTAAQPDYACARLLNQASVGIATFDTAHPSTSTPLAEWADVHPVDAIAPAFAGITAPEYLLAAGQNLLAGYAFDDSGISAVTLQIQPNGGTPSTLNCPDGQPDNGQWTCDWDLSGAADGDTFGVQLRATDTFGQAGDWTDWGTLMVDAAAPAISLSPETVRAISGTILTDFTLPALAGTVTDNGGIARMEGCFEGNCSPVSLQLDEPSPQTVADAPAVPIALSNAQTCGGSELVRTFTVSDGMTIGQVVFGLDAEYTRRNDLQATLQSPQGTQVRLLYPDGSDRVAENYDVTLLDAVGGQYSDGNGDDSAIPYFDRAARPNQPLSRFRGENAAGTWTLRVCDVVGTPATGRYLHSRLTVYPLNSAAQSGSWSFTMPAKGQLDYVAKTVSFTAEDVVGNRSVPLDATFTVDNVPPVLTATLLTASSPLTFTVPALVGMASDGGAVSNVYVTVQTPAGRVSAERVALADGHWQFNLHPLMPGNYTLWVRAGDSAGNIAEIAPLEIDITAPTALYLPLIMRDYTPPVHAPDLVVSNITANADQLQVVIKNEGNAPAENAFWVDAYINPTTVPTAVNQIWSDVSEEGAAWGVDGDVLPIAPGEVLTLTVQGTPTQTIGDAYFWAEYSHVSWMLSDGTPVYAQVDSANVNTDYGNVLENHEISGGAYNNIAGPVFSLANLLRAPLLIGAGEPRLADGNLPARPETVTTPPVPEMPFKVWLPLILKEGK